MDCWDGIVISDLFYLGEDDGDDDDDNDYFIAAFYFVSIFFFLPSTGWQSDGS